VGVRLALARLFVGQGGMRVAGVGWGFKGRNEARPPRSGLGRRWQVRVDGTRWEMKMRTHVIVMCLVVSAVTFSAAGAEKSVVRVSGRPMDVNGQTVIPRGLFGVHADSGLKEEEVTDWGVDCFRQIHYVPGGGSVALDKEGKVKPLFAPLAVVIDCQGDRFFPATCLSNPNYKEYFDKIGRQYAQRCKDANWPGYAEFWNEPYLNWAERSRKNYDPKFYDVSKAADDGPVTIKGWAEPLKYLRWRRLWAADPNTGKINYMVPVPKGAKAGDTITHEFQLYFQPKGAKSYKVVEKWDVYDPTAVSFWSGKQNYDFYMWMFLPWAKAIKEVNPKVTVIAGWDFAINADGWKAWELLYKPMLDDAWQWIDGVTEHHYGSDTRATTAQYEVVTGYSVAAHGKWIRCYNTETAGCVDPAVPGNRHANATPYGAFNYGLRDIVELIWLSPAKAVARTAHGRHAAGWGGGGDGPRFKMFKDLRGRLVHAASDDVDVWPVAALNGDRLVMAIYNDHGADRAVELAVDAPKGTRLGDAVVSWVAPKEEKGELAVHGAKMRLAGQAGSVTCTVPARSGVKVEIPLTGAPPAAAQLLRRQFFAKAPAGGSCVLNKVQAGKPVTLSVKLDAALLAAAEAARVRVVLERARGGEATVKLNGTAVKLPDRDWLSEVPVDAKLLKADNVLVFETSGDGYQLDVASIVLDAAAK